MPSRRQQQRDLERSAWRKRLFWIVPILLLLIAGSVGAWYWWSQSSSSADSDEGPLSIPSNSSGTSSAKEEVASFKVPSKEERATVTLVNPIESNESKDIYEVNNAKEVHLQLTAKQPAKITVRAADEKGEVLLQKQLAANEHVNVQHEQGLYLTVSSQAIDTLTINGVQIKPTITENEQGAYQFRLRQEE